MKLVPLGRPQQAPHPHHLRTWQGGATGGQEEPTPLAPRAPGLQSSGRSGSAACGPPASQAFSHSCPWERAEAPNPTQARIRARAGGREGRAGAMGWGVSANASTCRTASTTRHPRGSAGPVLGGQRPGPAGGGVPILLHHFLRRAARNTSPSSKICPRGGALPRPDSSRGDCGGDSPQGGLAGDRGGRGHPSFGGPAT